MLRWAVGFAAAFVSWFVLVRQYAWDSDTGAFKPNSALELAGAGVGALVVGLVAIGVLRLIGQSAFKRYRAAFLKVRDPLNAASPAHARLVDLLEHAPSVRTEGRNHPVQTQGELLNALGVSSERRADIEQRAAVARAQIPPNDNREHAIVLRPLEEGDINLRAFSCDYPFVLAYKDVVGEHLRRLSGNALLASKTLKHVFVHKRAEGPRGGAYPGALHIVGGNLEPQRDNENLERTMLREVREEFEIGDPALTVSARGAPVLLFEEPNTNWQGAIFLGVNVSEDTARKVILAKGKTAQSTDEGVVVGAAYKDLPELLKQTWVPSGRAIVLAWIALGAPVEGQRTMSDGEARRILEGAGLTRR